MRILIADDVPSARKILKKLLSQLGYEDVVEASDGCEGVDLLKAGSIDLVISDWEMPKLDGIGMLEQLRALPENNHIPVLFVTSSAEKEQVEQALNAGVTSYLCKPFGLEILRQKVSELIGSGGDAPR